ncbi:MAG: sulfurtransferase [Betaproteobacteria bacterium RIFCSPLOWO2_02_67_12]|nr:MAG: sulfurtransferase [Betaproteobacteria bacterium RIFCSPLOWO2_02_67_12]OGA27491.1 MAG: sulfurtransferase [Betaproteobacteria bacterium RIFCSPLOWO2_02_FULL_68_150]OGA66121.1 MAG: sulfurtransferase [Betaproteobacteria bacterium RIFCSPLOWO2_12_FULL_67_28]
MEFVQNNLLLIAVAFVSGAMLLWPLVRRGAGGPWLTTLQATHMINRDDAVVIDVRDAAEYAKGHILGARSAPLPDLERRLAELAKFKARPVIVHCEQGSRSSNAIDILRRNGFANVYNLAGGLAAWQQAGLPVEK